MRLYAFERFWADEEDKGMPVVVDLDRVVYFTNGYHVDHGLPSTILMLDCAGVQSVSVMGSLSEVREILERQNG